ncbi:hypothetical protein [Paracoccus yeei]|uniref:hypothetical protein n=1 Tax=Paracoccus yeei TaxID=147645 RepID=UPI00174AE536|nr:hypothetical protein [Paracoccus yeei]
MTTKLEIKGGGLEQFAGLAEKLASGEITTKAARAAINVVGKDARKQVKSALQKQMGLPWKDIVHYGGFETFRASAKHLNYMMVSKGKAIPLKAFRATQDAAGVQVRFGGKAVNMPGLFINAGQWNSGRPILDGHVFQRKTVFSLPIEKQYGPSVPAEIVKGETAKAFLHEADRLPREIARQMARETKGDLS